MNHKIILFLTLLVFHLGQLSSQAILVQYQRTQSFDEKIKKALPLDKVIAMDKSAKNTRSYYSLKICKDFSYWQFDSIHWGCAIPLKENNRPIDFIQKATEESKWMKFHFDPKEQYYSFTGKGLTPPIQWEISYDKTKNILGYKCYRAKHKGSPKIEVWFTPEIPTKYGPLDINGLPGLVTELTNYTAQYKAISIQSISPENCKNKPNISAKKIDTKERNRLWKIYDYSIKAQDFKCKD